ncbi:protein LAX PANICLE 2-like [Phragmites australis]|uniref:protein LAX PANICLE 2-like n=1 Tax=Phragmites australis TaxID=29695 RepID=UPI002D76E1EA|nr:protein LAX PANICLE 2-like [Phragmites australis]
MVPSRNLLHHDGKNNSKLCYPGQYCVGITAQLEASTAAARQDNYKPSRSPRLAMAGDEPAAAAGTSSLGGAGAGVNRDWLQLGLAAASSTSASSSGDNNSTDPSPPPAELDLFTYGYDKQQARMRPSLFPLPVRSYQYGRGRYRPTAASGSMSTPFMPPFRSSGDAMRVISPPRRTEAAGLWLTLQAAPNQVREPILPQIPKSYLRIKDSNMKVEVVMKYLAHKLGLARSHQVELTCRGQLLPPFLLVKYVRDGIWGSSVLWEEEPLGERPRRSPAAATTDHVMILCYSTSRTN